MRLNLHVGSDIRKGFCPSSIGRAGGGLYGALISGVLLEDADFEGIGWRHCAGAVETGHWFKALVMRPSGRAVYKQ